MTGPASPPPFDQKWLKFGSKFGHFGPKSGGVGRCRNFDKIAEISTFV